MLCMHERLFQWSGWTVRLITLKTFLNNGIVKRSLLSETEQGSLLVMVVSESRSLLRMNSLPAGTCWLAECREG